MNSVRCVRCGRDVPDDARFCPTCGLDLDDEHPRLQTGLLPAQQILHGRYQIVQKLAQGGQSAVYVVADLYERNTYSALKEMSESNLSPAEREKAVNDFLREADMLASLNHPALTRVYDRFVQGEKHFLVMEYVRGHNLEDEMIAANRPLEWGRVLHWGIVLCDVLWYLHNQQPPIIYRDLKPANVMLTPEGDLKLIDFGIARWLHPARAHDTSQLGTDGYAPLEQYTARSEIRSDLYALGASLYHLLTGRVPEAAPIRVAGQPLTPMRAINPAVPEPLEHVVLRALSLQARDRFSSAAEMRSALEWAFERTTQGKGGRVPTRPPAGAPRVTNVPANPRITRVPAPGAGGMLRPGAPPSGAPRLRLWPLRLDAGFLEANQTVALTLEVGNQGGGQLTGHTETNHHSLHIDPEVVTPAVTSLRVLINTSGLPEGPYTCHLAVRTNGGDQIVPVRFIVRPLRSVVGKPMFSD
ncbi:MAG TPA: protein kinase [Ktedonobacterales bacterium]|nr:protein kinase [Ktedonobacterales bacterium]